MSRSLTPRQPRVRACVCLRVAGHFPFRVLIDGFDCRLFTCVVCGGMAADARDPDSDCVLLDLIPDSAAIDDWSEKFPDFSFFDSEHLYDQLLHGSV
jgi:hypothetical protein